MPFYIADDTFAGSLLDMRREELALSWLRQERMDERGKCTFLQLRFPLVRCESSKQVPAQETNTCLPFVTEVASQLFWGEGHTCLTLRENLPPPLGPSPRTDFSGNWFGPGARCARCRAPWAAPPSTCTAGWRPFWPGTRCRSFEAKRLCPVASSDPQ